MILQTDKHDIPATKAQPNTPRTDRGPKGPDGQRLEPVASPGTDLNCHGFTFGGGEWTIGEGSVPTILEDNYRAVAKGKARVCDVVVYKKDGVCDHSGLVVEVDGNGNPKTIRSKWGPTGDVFDHPPDVQPYGDSFTTYERDPATLDQATQVELDDLRKDYDKIADKSSLDARNAAAKLCQKRNALRRKP